MKTTVNLPDWLVREAQRAAHEDNTTLKALVEAGLRTVLERRKQARPFVLRDAGADGNGLQPAFRGARWKEIRDTIYGPSE